MSVATPIPNFEQVSCIEACPSALQLTVPYLKSEYGAEYTFDAPVRLIYEMMHKMPSQRKQQFVLLGQVSWGTAAAELAQWPAAQTPSCCAAALRKEQPAAAGRHQHALQAAGPPAHPVERSCLGRVWLFAAV